MLEKFLVKEFEGLHILALDCNDDRLKEIKKKQQKAKEKAAGGRSKLVRRGTDSSLSSSDEEAIEAGRAPKGKTEKVYEAMVNPKSVTSGKVKHAFHKDGNKGEKELNEKA